MSGVATAIGGAAVVGGVVSMMNSNSATKAQEQAAANSLALQQQELDTQHQNEQPFLQAGYGALSQMQDPYYQQQFTLADFQQDPAYQFNLQQGMSALQNSAAARGGLLSGNTLQGISQYASGMANNEYEQAYQNFNNNQTTSFNRLASIAGLGQTGASGINGAAQNYGNAGSSALIGAGNAAAAGYMAQGNAINGALTGGVSGVGNSLQNQQALAQNQQFLNSLGNNGGGGYYGGGGGATPGYAGGASAGSGGGYNLGVSY